MQRKIEETYLGKTVTSLGIIGKSKAIDRAASDFDNANEKVQKIKRLINKREYYKDVFRYIPGTLNLMFEGCLKI